MNHGLNPHKATGPDNFLTRLLKDFTPEISPALTLIFLASLHQGTTPDDWKKANITPIFKKGDCSSQANYQPISLTSVCSNVMEHIIHSQIIQHLDTHKILSDQLIITLQDLTAALEQGEQIDSVLLDFSKVSHQLLTIKPQHCGVRGNLLMWSRSFLAGRSQRVLVEGQISGPAPVTSVVPPGSVFGPLLFLLNINDMPQKVDSISQLFADDTLLYRKIQTIPSCTGRYRRYPLVQEDTDDT